MSRLDRRFSMQCAGAVALGSLLVHCSYDIVLSRPTSAGQGGAAGRDNVTVSSAAGSDPITNTAAGGAGSATRAGSAGTATAVNGVAGAPPRTTLAPASSWQWQLTGTLDASVTAAVYVVDLTESTDAALLDLRDQGRTIVCNFSAGTSESWRVDVNALPLEVLGNPLSGHSDEFWLDIRSPSVRSLMAKRLDLALTRGCHGVLPDSIDGYGADTGFSITKSDALDYLDYLSREARSRALAIGLSNAPELAATAEPWFEFEVEVNCLEYDECDRYQAFVSASKPVLHAEIVSDAASGGERLSGICGDPRRSGFSTIVKTSQLDAWRLSCE